MSPKLIKKFRSLSVLRVLLIVVAVFLVLLQLERFINKGTFMGYQLRQVESTEISNPFNSAVPSETCNKVTIELVQDLLKQPVARSGNVADRKKPLLYSTCSYKTTKGPTRTITVSQQEVEAGRAKQSLTDLKSRSKGESVSGIGDEAYFSTTTNQLTVRKSDKIIRVKVSKARDDKQPDAKELDIQITKILL